MQAGWQFMHMQRKVHHRTKMNELTDLELRALFFLLSFYCFDHAVPLHINRKFFHCKQILPGKNIVNFYKNDASFILAYHSIQATKSKSRKANEKLGLFFNRCHLLTYTGFQFAFRIMRPSRKCNLFRLL